MKNYNWRPTLPRPTPVTTWISFLIPECGRDVYEQNNKNELRELQLSNLTASHFHFSKMNVIVGGSARSIHVYSRMETPVITSSKELLPTLGRPGNHKRNSLRCLAIALAIGCRLRASTREGNGPAPSAFSGQSWRAVDSHFRPTAESRVELHESYLAPSFLGGSQSDDGPNL